MKQKTRYNKRCIKPKAGFLLKIDTMENLKTYQEKIYIYTILIMQKNTNTITILNYKSNMKVM